MAEASPPNYPEFLFKEGLFTDFVIECGGYSFKVHKSELYSYSGYFRILLTTQMKEAAESKVVFEDIDPSLIARMLVFCYNRSEYPEILNGESLPSSCHAVATYDKFKGTQSHSFLRAELALDLIDIADRFDIPNLQKDAFTSFKNAFLSLDDSGTTPQALLDREKCLPLVKRMYSTPFSLRDSFRQLVLNALKRHSRRGHRGLAEMELLVDMVKEVEDLRDDVIRDYMTPGTGKPARGSYTINLFGPEGPHNKEAARVDAKTTAQSLFKDYCEWKGRAGGSGYLSYNDRKLDESLLIDCLGLEDLAPLKVVYD